MVCPAGVGPATPALGGRERHSNMLSISMLQVRGDSVGRRFATFAFSSEIFSVHLFSYCIS